MEENVKRLEEIAGEIYRLNESLATDHSKSLQPNKAAAVRARKATLEMEKLCREYRKVSLEIAKK